MKRVKYQYLVAHLSTTRVKLGLMHTIDDLHDYGMPCLNLQEYPEIAAAILHMNFPMWSDSFWTICMPILQTLAKREIVKNGETSTCNVVNLREPEARCFNEQLLA